MSEPVTGLSMSRDLRKPDFCICENKDADQLPVTAKLISAFNFATQIIQSLFYLNPKFQASSHLLQLYLICVEPGRKPDCWFSHDVAQILRQTAFQLQTQPRLLFYTMSSLIRVLTVCTSCITMVEPPVISFCLLPNPKRPVP